MGRAYVAYPPAELKMTLLMSGIGLVVMVAMGARGKFEKSSKAPERKA